MSHPLVVPTSMNSMKRTAISREEKRSTRSINSSSLTSFLTTVLILIGPKPTDSAASIPANTAATVCPESVIAAKVASSNASRLTVTRSKPAADKAGAYLGNSTPLVVIAISTSRSASSEMSSGSPLRSRGSPPESRIFSTPSEMNKPARRSISS